MADLDKLARTLSPTARTELRHVARYQDTHGVHPSSIHPATRQGLITRGLIALHPNADGLPDRRVRTTPLGDALLAHTESRP